MAQGALLAAAISRLSCGKFRALGARPDSVWTVLLQTPLLTEFR